MLQNHPIRIEGVKVQNRSCQRRGGLLRVAASSNNSFYQEVFNEWLNLHRPCLFSTEVVSEKGKIKKVYKHRDVKTSLECLVLLNESGLVAFKSATTLDSLLSKANEKTDLQAAQEMQKAKAELFAMFNKPERMKQN